MITEDYVSFEIAKFLKEKEFDVNVINSWHIVPSETCNFEDLEKVICGDINEPEYSEDYYPMITTQMAMKWLREVHKISIEITSTGYLMDNDVNWECDIKAGHRLYFKHITNEKSFESCAEAAIKYCLKNLI